MIQSVQCHDLRILKRVLTRWVKINIRLAREWLGDDHPCWYNERAVLSLLAGAIWLEGGFALEEYAADKRETERNRRAKYSGRVDLYLKLGRNEFIAEAKRSWSGAVRANENTAHQIRQKLDEACEDIRRVPSNGQRKLGVLFATPYMPRTEKRNVDQHVDEWI